MEQIPSYIVPQIKLRFTWWSWTKLTIDYTLQFIPIDIPNPYFLAEWRGESFSVQRFGIDWATSRPFRHLFWCPSGQLHWDLSERKKNSIKSFFQKNSTSINRKPQKNYKKWAEATHERAQTAGPQRLKIQKKLIILFQLEVVLTEFEMFVPPVGTRKHM